MFFGKKKPVQAPPPPPRQEGEERRQAARYQTAVVTCALGDLKDLSRTGMRVQRRGLARVTVNQRLTIELCSPSDSMEVSARVVRVTQIADGRWEITFEFVDLSEETAVLIENLARFGVARRPTAANVSENARKLVKALRLPDHYKALGLGRKASPEEIQKAFRDLARKYHPDVNHDPDSVKVFEQINAAHEALSDPEQRLKYDKLTSFGEAA